MADVCGVLGLLPALNTHNPRVAALSTHLHKTLVAPLGGGNCMGDTYLLRSSAVIKMRSGRTHLRDYQSSNSGLLCLDCPAGMWLARL
jgi:hypothetical protein